MENNISNDTEEKREALKKACLDYIETMNLEIAERGALQGKLTFILIVIIKH